MNIFKIRKLTKKDIDHSRVDAISVDLSLSDYDWLDYKLDARLFLKKYGLLRIVFSYSGTALSSMLVEQYNDGFKKMVPVDYFEFSSEIFLKHLSIYLTEHNKTLNQEQAFVPDEYVFNFYNEIIGRLS